MIFSRQEGSFDELFFRLPDRGCRMNQYSTPPGSSVNVGTQELMICDASGIVACLKKAGFRT
jgi:hypothetical protein